MKLYLLQTNDYEPAAYGVFSTLELAEAAAQKASAESGGWSYRFVVTEYESDEFVSGAAAGIENCHYFDFTPKKKAK